MNRTNTLVAATAAFAIAAAALLAVARPAEADFAHDRAEGVGRRGPGSAGGGEPGAFRGPRRFDGERIARYLELTDDQRESLRGLAERHRADVEPLFAERRDLHAELRQLVEQPSPDPAAIGRLVLELAGQREAVRASREAFAGELDAVLVGEQKVKWQHLRELRAASSPRHLRSAGRGRG
jgi:Spy/CpxP family protein refolding chaperone